MRKVFIAFIFFLFIFVHSSHSVSAESNFATDYNATYTVNADSSTHVSLNGTLTNLTNQFYVSSYSIEVGFSNINNLKTSDEQGAIIPSVVKKANGTSININFNKNAIGLNQKSKFNISFDTNEVAQNFQNTWDVNIPGISSEDDFSSFNVTVNYPNFLGKPTYIKPILASNAKSENNNLFFTKQDLGDSGISIGFGNFQVYDFDLKYHLENPNLFSVSTEIALPPTTNYQDVYIGSINPKPKNVREDNDGNWLATFILPSSKKINVEVKGKTKVYLNPRSENLDANKIKDYLKPNDFWESDSSRIVNLAQKLKTPYAIYQYVVSNLHYDFSRIETKSPRLGALNTLEHPNSAVCLEFTDLFVALSRAAGIPAREVDGYAYTSNENQRPLSLISDILHAWPEYYDFDKKTWIMVDPTWGNTTRGVDYFNTLDFDHVAFVVKGENSVYPVPAGGYKLSSDLNSKDVSVDIGTDFTLSDQKPISQIIISDNIISGFDVNGLVKITNSGHTLLNPLSVDVSTDFLTPRDRVLSSMQIPPFGYQTIPIMFDKTGFLTNANDNIKITIGNYTSYKNVKILPFFVNKYFALGGITFVSILLGLSIVAYIYRRISLLRQTREGNLRWKSDQPQK